MSPIKNSKPFSWQKLLTVRTELFGFFAIGIVIFHCNAIFGFGNGSSISKLISKVLSQGNMCVDLFFFFSALGLKRSYEKNGTMVYYQNRIKRVIIPYLPCALIYYCWYDLFFSGKGAIQYLLDLTTFNYWFRGCVGPLWYISMIVLLYLLYPILYKIDTATKHLGIIAMIAGVMIWEIYLFHVDSSLTATNIERNISRIPVFLLGLVMADHIYNNKKLKLMEICIMAASVILMYLPDILCPKYHQPFWRWRSAVIGLLAVLALGFVFCFCKEHSIGLVIFTFMGKLSLEIYMIHILIISVLENYDLCEKLPWYVWYVVLITVTMVLSYLLNLLSKKLISVIWKA